MKKLLIIIFLLICFVTPVHSISLIGSGISETNPCAGYENFSTGWTETDPDGFLTKTSDCKISWSADFNSSDDYFSRDASPALNGDFDIIFEAYTNSSGSGGTSILTVPILMFLYDSGQDLACFVTFGKSSVDGDIGASLVNDEFDDDSSIALSPNTLYYFRLKRDDNGGTGTGQVTLGIYANASNRASESSAIDTLSVNMVNQLDFDTLFTAYFYNDSDAGTHVGYIQNINLSYSP